MTNSTSTFTVAQLIGAMASEQQVLDRIFTTTDSMNSEEDQTWFATMIQDEFWNNPMGPSKRYLRSLVQKYIQKIGEHDNIQSDHLLELLLQTLSPKQQQQNNQLPQDNIPDPYQFCHVRFSLPSFRPTIIQQQQQQQDEDEDELRLTVRIYPYHNDVALRIWEAGITLTEYLLDNPQWIDNQRIVELGAGVGLTSLVLATHPMCQHVYCTDFTEICLQNLQYNIDLNQALFVDHSQQEQKQHNTTTPTTMPTVAKERISCGYLEWDAFGNYQEPFDVRLQQSVEMIQQANLLIAADVVYDVTVIPALVQTFKRFLCETMSEQSPTTKTILLASTQRRQETFTMLQDILNQEGINCQLKADGNTCAQLPLVFPMNLVQPRRDVRIYALTMK